MSTLERSDSARAVAWYQAADALGETPDAIERDMCMIAGARHSLYVAGMDRCEECNQEPAPWLVLTAAHLQMVMCTACFDNNSTDGSVLGAWSVFTQDEIECDGDTGVQGAACLGSVLDARVQDLVKAGWTLDADDGLFCPYCTPADDEEVL